MDNYIVATIKDWNIAQYNKRAPAYNGNWHLITDKKELTYNHLKHLNPKYIFFPHWSWIVPEEIINNFNCVCFHMTDLPYGRGGSPMQNLISLGHTTTKLSALKMEESIDTGPIYLKRPLSLEGTAQQIFLRCSALTFDMIEFIVSENPEVRPQEGPVTAFSRRNPSQSVIDTNLELDDIFDHIRMLDADSYPKAYIKHGKYKLEFTNAKKSNDALTANIKLTLLE